MGLAERAYSRREGDEPSRFAAMANWSVTTWLSVVLVVVFLLDALLTPQHPFPVIMTPDAMQDIGGQIASGEIVTRTFGPLTRHGHFSASTAIGGRQWWRFLTFQAVHADVWPLVLNLLCLYSIGRAMEERLGGRRFAILYAVSALAAPATYLGLHAIHPTLIQSWAPLAGATAGVLGVLASAIWIGPDDEVAVWSSGMTLPRRTVALVACALVALIAIKRDIAGAGWGHVGGMAAGLVTAAVLRAPRLRWP